MYLYLFLNYFIDNSAIKQQIHNDKNIKRKGEHNKKGTGLDLVSGPYAGPKIQLIQKNF